jgi:hypothetical protein
MAKRKQMTRKGKKVETKSKRETPPVEEDDESKYGGLPDRNLKKNLGCG